MKTGEFVFSFSLPAGGVRSLIFKEGNLQGEKFNLVGTTWVFPGYPYLQFVTGIFSKDESGLPLHLLWTARFETGLSGENYLCHLPGGVIIRKRKSFYSLNRKDIIVSNLLLEPAKNAVKIRTYNPLHKKVTLTMGLNLDGKYNCYRINGMS